MNTVSFAGHDYYILDNKQWLQLFRLHMSLPEIIDEAKRRGILAPKKAQA
jgi:hypothetical protein